MKLAPPDLKHLSALLDHALELPEPEREVWLASLQGDALALAPTLRELLAKQASRETGDLIDQLPAFTIAPEPAASSALAAGDTVGPYRLVHELGHGGMGEVWLAERIDAQLKRQVALKLPMLGLRKSVLVQRFARERDILGALAHPHIARLYDAGLADDGQPYLALEYVEGQPINTYCDEQRLDARARIALLRQVMAAVQFAHANLVIHRDLKPSNVLVTHEGRAMLLDFGIAKLLQDEQGQAQETELTQLGGRALTLGYAAPEQITGAPVSIAADVYALGVLLYELLAGQRPFAAETSGALEHAVLHQEPERPSQHRGGAIAGLPRSLQADLDTIALKALKKAPAERYATVNALIDDLERFQRGEAVWAQPDSRWYQLRKFVERHRVSVAASMAGALALAGAAVVAAWQADLAREQARRAEQQADLATTQSRRAAAVQTFLLDIFRANSLQQADPLTAQRTTARELLDIGAARVDESLKDEPESQLAVRQTLADMYLQLGLTSRAEALSEKNLQLARRAYGARSPRLAEFLLGHVATLQEKSQRERVPALLKEALDALDAAGDWTSMTRGDVLLETAFFWDGESIAQSRSAADAAAEFFTRHHPRARARVTAHIAAGRARQNPGDHAAAQEQYRLAVDAARQHGDTASTLLHEALNHLGDAQRGQLGFAEAEASYREALDHALRAYGPGRGETLVTRGRLAGVLATVGRRAEADALRKELRDAIEQPDPRLDDGWRAAISGVLAEQLPELGRPDLAEALLRADVEDLRRKFPRAGVTARREQKLAEVLVALDQLDEAEAILRQARSRWALVVEGNGPTQADAMFAITAARLALARGNATEALDELSRVTLTTPADRLWLAIERSRAMRASGQSADAVQAATAVVLELEKRPQAQRPKAIEASARLALGEALAERGDLSHARTQLEQAVALRRAHDAIDSRELERATRALARTNSGTATKASNARSGGRGPLAPALSTLHA